LREHPDLLAEIENKLRRKHDLKTSPDVAEAAVTVE
jgi:hypothetical protein